ncbi:hypothetical protein BDY21DRAFT_343084 [Lineolata rhizophorae]|uniref:Uncharacterized protein n=1 Tax=Lineolata rhizophorae TaxID=578093 RepID=A0A6A6P1R5_9PEZI|nr:hypothetical protein BDY21DRAFT_343084 [Lineolata rhizophorae]
MVRAAVGGEGEASYAVVRKDAERPLRKKDGWVGSTGKCNLSTRQSRTWFVSAFLAPLGLLKSLDRRGVF